jgi:ABC-type phosphate transport system substrate-binding protein
MRGKFLLGVLFLAIIGLSFSVPGVALADDIIVIGNRSVPASQLSPKEIKKIYLGKKKNWSNGLKVVFVMLVKNDVSEKFLKVLVRKNPSMYSKYWKKKMFTGSGTPPIVFDKEKDLVAYVAKTKGAVGYVSSKSYSESVKFLSVLH